MASHPVSIRFRNAAVADRLRSEAAATGDSASALAEQLIDEGLRSRRHPLITFRGGPTGRRAAIVGGPDVWELIGGIVGGDVATSKRVARAVDVFGLRRELVDAALDYYAEFAADIDGEIRANAEAADEAERLWRRRQELLAG